jgi:DNA polymerase III delta prime subunit
MLQQLTENQFEEKETNIPWIEKYRPSNFNDIVLDANNRKLFENIIAHEYFPNLLFYGPPGTGKTTTIINLINEYQLKTNGTIDKSMFIHLNASDERGIDIIRNQIHHFVKSMNLFKTGIKFVILDEVDYMTKNAQIALKYLLQSSIANVRFCLICNYITKIDESLKNEFITIRFNQLPKNDINQFIKIIANKEKIEISDEMINVIQDLYNSDIRSMINFIQLNNRQSWTNSIMNINVLSKIHDLFLATESIPNIQKYINEISIQYNTDKRTIIKKYMNYMIRINPEYLNIRPPILDISLLNICENILHSNITNIDTCLYYFLVSVSQIYNHSSI